MCALATLRQLTIYAAISLLAGTAVAREFWLEPARFFLEPGAAVHLRRLSGEAFAGRPWSGTSKRLVRFQHNAPGQPPADLLPLVAATDTLATTLTFRQPGTHLISLLTNEALLTLPPAEFQTYLREQGMEQALALREQRKENMLPGREAYRRCAKTLLQVGRTGSSDSTRTWARPVGLPLELVPEQNPYTLPLNGALTLRLLADGRPLAGQLVTLWRRGATPQPLVSKLRSNQNGRVLFRIIAPGEYLVGAVQMVAAPPGQAADWRSTWTTLTFAVGSQKRPK